MQFYVLWFFTKNNVSSSERVCEWVSKRVIVCVSEWASERVAITSISILYPSAIKAVGYSDYQRRVKGRAGAQKFSSY